MLQIKKISILKKIHFNLLFLFRSKLFKNEFFFKKKTPYTITLRSPKHFNIGKNKIVSVNSKALNINAQINKSLYTNMFFSKTSLWKSSTRFSLKSTHFVPKSITILIKTQFKICGWDFSFCSYY